MVTYRPLGFKCSCDREPKRYLRIGVSVSQELVVEWYCKNCKGHRHVMVPLATLASCAPTAEEIFKEVAPDLRGQAFG